MSHKSHGAPSRSHLSSHERSIHEGERFYCDECNYQGSRMGDINKHKAGVHSNVECQYEHCDHKTTGRRRKSLMKDHIKTKHTYTIKNEDQT